MINGLNIADIHFGVNKGGVDSYRIYNELQDNFIPIVKKFKDELDYISINGDLFDSKLNLNSDASKLTIRFINELSDICINNKIHLLLIRGTKTHDNDQMDNFKYLEKKNPYFKIFNTVGEYNKIDNFKILCVPEEYMEDEDEYYKEYKEKYKNNPDSRPNIILGHGTFDVLAFKSQKIDSERPIKGAPVFKFSEWENYTDGIMIFGHIHPYQNYKNKLFYSGSFSRWSYNEEEEKGFIMHSYNIEDNKHTTKFIKNKDATLFKTVKLKDIISDDMDLEEQMKTVEKYRKKYDNIRIEVDEDIPRDKYEVLRETVSEKDNMNLKINKNLSASIKENTQTEYDFLQDNNDIVDNVKKYIKVRFNEDIDKDEIIEIIYEE